MAQSWVRVINLIYFYNRTWPPLLRLIGIVQSGFPAAGVQFTISYFARPPLVTVGVFLSLSLRTCVSQRRLQKAAQHNLKVRPCSPSHRNEYKIVAPTHTHARVCAGFSYRKLGRHRTLQKLRKTNTVLLLPAVKQCRLELTVGNLRIQKQIDARPSSANVQQHSRPRQGTLDRTNHAQ